MAQQVADHAQLVRDLRAAQDHHVGPLRVVQDLGEGGGLGEHQGAGRVRQQPGHVVDAGLLAVHHSEPVADEEVGEGGQLFGESEPLRVVLAGLGCLEPQVLQQRHVAVLQGGHGPAGRLPDHVVGEGDRPAQQLGQPLGNRAQRQLRPALALGTAQVGHHDHPGAAVGEGADRADTGPDAAVVGDDAGAVRAVGQRHVQVRADQHPAPGDVQVVGAPHARRPTGSSRRARPGRPAGSSSPTRCRTTPGPSPGPRRPRWSRRRRRCTTPGW